MNIIVHVGPGKTGSSAIQKWLNDQTDKLLAMGLYYPPHPVDENGVSSGNALSLFNYNAEGHLSFSESKANEVLAQALEQKCHTLVLSSEAFIARYEPILDFFKSCKVIFYLRNPLECAESLYNQSVKRHFNTERISAPKTGYGRLLKLKKHISEKKHSELEVRLYGKQFFIGNDVVSDFVHAIGLQDLSAINSTYINKSYSFEALEFKRALNYFPSTTFHFELDKSLQSYVGKIRHFSILKPKVYQESVVEACQYIDKMSKSVGIPMDEMVNSIARLPQKMYVEQQVNANQVKDLLIYLYEQRTWLFNAIRFIVEQALLPQPQLNMFGEAFALLSTQKINALQKTFLFKSKHSGVKPLTTKSLDDFDHLVYRLTKDNARTAADRLRDISLYFESKGDTLEAFRFMLSAKLKRTHGKIINQKLKEYSEKIMQDQRSLNQ